MVIRLHQRDGYFHIRILWIALPENHHVVGKYSLLVVVVGELVASDVRELLPTVGVGMLLVLTVRGACVRGCLRFRIICFL